MRRAGWTLIELLVVIAIIALLVAILLPTLSKVRDEANKARCGATLHNLHIAMHHYAEENEGNLPYLPPSPDQQWRYVGYQASKELNSTNADVCRGNSRALYTGLIRGGKLSAEGFICPGRGGHIPVPDSKRNTIWDFPSDNYISYSYQNTWGAGVPKLTDQEGKPLMADRNPQFTFAPESTGGTMASADAALTPESPAWGSYYAVKKEPRTCNSRNHGGGGQNVLYTGGHVRWSSTPLCGLSIDGKIDNIYTQFVRSGTSGASQADIDYGRTPADNASGLWKNGPGHTLDAWLVP